MNQVRPFDCNLQLGSWPEAFKHFAGPKWLLCLLLNGGQLIGLRLVIAGLLLRVLFGRLFGRHPPLRAEAPTLPRRSRKPAAASVNKERYSGPYLKVSMAKDR